MVYYITAPEHLLFVKELCESNDMGFEYSTSIRDIKLFVNTEVKKLSHIKYFVFDIDCLQNTDKEIYDSICGMPYMAASARVIVIALGRSTSDSLIGALLNRNVCNIVLSKDYQMAKREIEECFSEKGRTKETVAPESIEPFAEKSINPVTAMPIQRTKAEIPAVSYSMITIGMCGIEPHIGTTHHALALTAYLAKQRKKVCYLESNIHGDIQKLLDIYEGSAQRIRSDGGIDWNGVIIYHDYSFLDVLSMGYQYYIYDYGACRDITAQEFLSNDIKIFVSGAKPWEFYNYSKTMGTLVNVPDIDTIMNFSVPHQRSMLFVDELKEQTYFAEYAPDPFDDGINDSIYEAILSRHSVGADARENVQNHLQKMKKRVLERIGKR